MSQPSPILVSVDTNEAMRPRAAKIEQAVKADDHFELSGNSGDLPFDLRFTAGGACPETCNFRDDCEKAPGIVKDCNQWTPRKTIHVEVKDFTSDNNSDYLSSILTGHLWEQCLAAREMGEPFVIAVLGDDKDIAEACKKAAYRTHRLDVDKMLQYHTMVDGFEANALSKGIQVWRLKTDPYARLLLRIRKILHGGDLSGFAPSPPEDERQKVGLSILAGKGIGPAKAGAILGHFRIWLEPKTSDDYLTDCDGIGENLALRIAKQIPVGDCQVCRPKGLKARRTQ